MPLDPVLAERLPLLAGVVSYEQLDSDEDARRRMTAFEDDGAPWPVPEVPVRDVAMDAAGYRFRSRVYGRGTGAAPCLVWAHGGAFAAGGIEMNEADLVARELVRRTGGVLVSVDYTLVPQASYPALHRQVAAAWAWARQHAQELGVDESRIGLGGASAGGALALAAARAMPADGAHSTLLPAYLVLAYPVTHREWTPDPHVERLMAGMPQILRFPLEGVRSFTDAYLAGHPSPDLAFADGADLAGLPPVLVVLAEYDDLRAPAEGFVEQARACGVTVERRLARGMLHGHLNRTPVLGGVDETLDDIARVMVEGAVRGEP